MKIGEENKTIDSKPIGHAFGWPGEYSLAAVYLDEVNFDDDKNEGSYDEAWILTDQDSYVSVIETAIRDKILVDVFENQLCCDLFLLYLKQWLRDNVVDNTYRKQIEDWYFGKNVGYRTCK